MAGLFDEVLASGGWDASEAQHYGMYWGQKTSPTVSGEYSRFRPFTPGPVNQESDSGNLGGLYGDQYNWSRLTADTSSFYKPAGGSGDASYDASTDERALRKWLETSGNTLMGYNEGDNQYRNVFGPDGKPLGPTQTFNDNDSHNKLAHFLTIAGIGSAGYVMAGGAGLGGAEALGEVGGYGFTSTEVPGVATQLGEAGAAAGGATAAGGGAAPTATSGSFLESLATGAGNMSGKDWVNIISGIYGMNLSREAQKASDPFGPYRAGYGQQLAALEAHPNLITSRPGWRAGLDVIDRQMGARGYLGSGNQRGALSRYAGDFYDKEMQRLAGLAGAGAAPGAGRFQSANLAGQSLASIGYGLAPYFKGGGGGSGGTSGSQVGGDLMYGWGQNLGNYFGGP